MAITITLGIQKGGCGKSTSTGILAHLLSESNKKVLVVDMDSQGNQTEFLTQVDDIYIFDGRTIFEGLKDSDASPYVVEISENLHLIPATDTLATFTYWLYHEGKNVYPEKNGSHLTALRHSLRKLYDKYDYILIDTPPALGEQTLNALSASDYTIVMFESSKFCLSAVQRYIDSVNWVKENLNENLQIAGILRNLNDKRRSDMKALIKHVESLYPELVFDTIIERQASTGRLVLSGFGEENKELNHALTPYRSVLRELLNRV